MAVGTWDVNGMLRRMSCRQLMEWQAFDLLEPFGPERADYRAGAIVNVLMNVNRNTKRKPKPLTLEETTPMFGDAAKPGGKKVSWQQMKLVGQTMTAASRPTKEKKRGS